MALRSDGYSRSQRKRSRVPSVPVHLYLFWRTTVSLRPTLEIGAPLNSNWFVARALPRAACAQVTLDRAHLRLATDPGRT